MPRSQSPLARRTVRKFLIEFRGANGRFLLAGNSSIQSHVSGGLTVAWILPESLKRVAGDVASTGPTDEQITELAGRLEAFKVEMQAQVEQALAASDKPEVLETTVVDGGFRAGALWFRLSSPTMLAQQGRGAHAVTVAQQATEVLAEVSGAAQTDSASGLPDMEGPEVTVAEAEAAVATEEPVEASEQE